MIESKSCKDCVKEIETLVIKKLKDIINHRSQCRKCQGCYRLQKVIDKYNKNTTN